VSPSALAIAAAVYESGIDLEEGASVGPEASETRLAKISHEHVGAFDHPLEHRPTGL